MDLSALGGISGSSGLGGLSGMGGASLGGNSLGGLPGVGSGGAGSGGIAPTTGATQAQGASFGETLKDMIIHKPSATKSEASELAARFAAGENVDPHKLAIASAKAGVEIQMATRTISSAVSAVRTLFQMQV